MSEERCELEGAFIHATGKAICVDFDGDGEGTWLPLSQVELDFEPDEAVEGLVVTVEVPEWLAIEKGLV